MARPKFIQSCRSGGSLASACLALTQGRDGHPLPNTRIRPRLFPSPRGKFPLPLLALCGLVAFCASGLAADQIRASFQDPNRGPTPHETPISAAEILRRALVARGGEAAAARIRSYRCQGTADFAWGGRGNFEFLAARPNLSRAIFDFGAGSRFDFAFDGRTAWEARPGLAPETQIGEKLQESRDQAAWFAGYDDPRNYLSVAYVGETLFEGAKCHALKVITQSGLEQTHYYNASNYLLAGMLEQVTVEARPTWCISSFLDYRKVAGFRFPVRYRCRMEESEWVIRLHSIHVNGVKSSDFVPAAAPVPATPNAKAAETLARLPDAEIKTLLRDCIDGDKLGVGLVVGRLDAEGSRIFSYGKLGDESSPEVNGDTLFEIGSITKVFTRLLLHDMVARGAMNLDDPVQMYLPASVRMPRRHGKQITLWDLSTHTSGLPRDIGGPRTVENLYAFLSNHKLRRDPGEQFEYSNLGLGLLGHVIALTAGEDYETLVRERICRPLKMDSTALTLAPELQARRAIGHAPANRPAGYIGLEAFPAAGGLFSTGNDLLKFASATLGLTPCPLTPLMKKTDSSHNGGTFGFSTVLALDLKQRRALVVLSNCRNDDLPEHFRPLLSYQTARPPGTVAVSADELDRFVGQYYAHEERIRTVRRDGDRLLLQEFGKPSCVLFPLSETNFYNQWFDCQATFVRDNQTGPATELLLGDTRNPGWRGLRIPGLPLPPSNSPLTEGDCPPRKDSDLQGVWQATVWPWYWPFFALHVRVRIAEPSTNSFRAELDCPDLDAKDVPLAVIYDRPTVEVIVASGEGSFRGRLNPARTKVTGTWKQSGHSIRVTFQRVRPSLATRERP